MDEPDLSALETELARLLAVDPPRGLRKRIADRVSLEGRLGRQRDWLASAAVAAALAVLWVNVSWTASREADRGWRGGDAAAISAEQIERLLPGLPRREAMRQALVLNSGPQRLSALDQRERAVAAVRMR